MNKLRPATWEQVEQVKNALVYLKLAREKLAVADAPLATNAVRHALKSTEGALRHAERRVMASERQPLQLVQK